MSGRVRPKINTHSEFELDLAPLLAVMVKLVPVLLVSSAFVQMMIIETELPQVVQEAIKQEQKNPAAAVVTLMLDKKSGARIIVSQNGADQVRQIDLAPDKKFDYQKIHQELQTLKAAHPEVFKIEFNPAPDVSYREIVRIMDEARRSRAQDVRFPVKNSQTGETTTTDYMFPEVVFGNMLEG